MEWWRFNFSMTSLNIFLENLSEENRNEFLLRLASAALKQYSIGESKPVFLQHNSGITYRVDSADRSSGFLLKIHEPVGTGSKASLEQIQARMKWLEELAQTSSLIVQVPILNRDGMFATKIPVSETGETVLGTLQNWLEGEQPDGDFTLAQAESLGEMMAILHQTSSQWRSSSMTGLGEYQAGELLQDVEQLHTLVDANIISSSQYLAIEQAGQQIRQITGLLGIDPQVYGPIHGDLHQGNVLFFENRVCPIDFDGLRNSYYLLDLGTTLYHILYQRVEFRNALINGYTSVRQLSGAERQYLEAFVTWSAINNLAFQSTIPQQLTSKFFVRNIRQLTDEFCLKVIANEPFVLVENG
jgi:Ser/Thr protein kinase RdoA (MazF antagonist)